MFFSLLNNPASSVSLRLKYKVEFILSAEAGMLQILQIRVCEVLQRKITKKIMFYFILTACLLPCCFTLPLLSFPLIIVRESQPNDGQEVSSRLIRDLFEK